MSRAEAVVAKQTANIAASIVERIIVRVVSTIGYCNLAAEKTNVILRTSVRYCIEDLEAGLCRWESVSNK